MAGERVTSEGASVLKKPKYLHVRGKLESLIRSKAYSLGQSFLTEKQVCKKFGVSGATARRALDDLRRDGMLQRRRGAGTFVATEVGPGHAVRYKTVGVVLYDASNAFVPGMASILQGVGEVLQKKQYHMQVLVSTDGDVADLVKNARVDGLIIGYQQIDEDSLGMLARDYPALVAFNRGLTKENICSVSTDRILSMMLLGEHFAQSGHRRVLFFHGDPSWEITKEYLRGYEAAVNRYKLEKDESCLIRAPDQHYLEIKNSYTPSQEFIENIGRILDSDRKPLAIIAPTYRLASEIIKLAGERNLSIPGDVAVASLGQPDAEPERIIGSYDITYIKHDAVEFGRVSAEFLFKLIEDKKNTRKKIFLETELVIGTSSRGAETTPS